MLSIERGLPRDLHEFINEIKQRYTMEMVYTKCKPRFSQERALSQLKADGYKLAVCSNSVRATVSLMMERSGLAPYLDLQISNEDVSKGKPDSEMYLKAMHHFGLLPHECLIVEDNENGIKAARASGAHLLVVREVHETNLDNIRRRIHEINSQQIEQVEA
jgi:HAD superfamily hydrolase (TIGR01509 family)